VSVLRLTRLLRMARVLRLLTMFTELYLMISALATTMRTIFWASLLLLLVFCVLSIISLELLLPVQQRILKELEAAGKPPCDRCDRAFSSVRDSMVTLFSTLVLGDGVVEILVPLAEADIVACLFIVVSVAVVYMGISNLVLSVIVDQATDARCNDVMFKSLQDRKCMFKTRQEIMGLWQSLCPESDHISMCRLQKLWKTSPLFHDYFKSLDIDFVLLEFTLKGMDRDHKGEVTFEDFAHEVVRIKTTNAGPVAAVLQFQVSQVLDELRDIKSNLDSKQGVSKGTLEGGTRECTGSTCEGTAFNAVLQHGSGLSSEASNLPTFSEVSRHFSNWGHAMMGNVDGAPPSSAEGTQVAAAAQQPCQAEATRKVAGNLKWPLDFGAVPEVHAAETTAIAQELSKQCQHIESQVANLDALCAADFDPVHTAILQDTHAALKAVSAALWQQQLAHSDIKARQVRTCSRSNASSREDVEAPNQVSSPIQTSQDGVSFAGLNFSNF